MSTHRHFECGSSNGRATPQNCEASSRRSPKNRRYQATACRLSFLILASASNFRRSHRRKRSRKAGSKRLTCTTSPSLWNGPREYFGNPDDPAVICVVGDERTSDVLEPAVSGKKANGRPVEARRPHSPAEFKSCHVLFIGFSDKERIAQLLNELQRSSVLTVGQSDQFIRLGGMINLALQKHHHRTGDRS